MHHLRRRGTLKSRRNVWIAQYLDHQFFQVRIGHGLGRVQQAPVHLIHIEWSVRKKIRQVDLCRLRHTELLQRQLGFVAVNFDARLHLHKIVAIHFLGVRLKLFPHARFDGAAAITEFHPQVRLSRRWYCGLLSHAQGKNR